jgi:hypothetical protein
MLDECKSAELGCAPWDASLSGHVHAVLLGPRVAREMNDQKIIDPFDDGEKTCSLVNGNKHGCDGPKDAGTRCQSKHYSLINVHHAIPVYTECMLLVWVDGCQTVGCRNVKYGCLGTWWQGEDQGSGLVECAP